MWPVHSYETINNRYSFLDSNFLDLGNGVVYDNILNLLWLKDTSYFKQKRKWQEAIILCEKLSVGGINGWRLPTKEELIRMYPIYGNNKPYYEEETQPFINIKGGFYRTGIGNCHSDPIWPNVCVSLKKRKSSCCGKSDGSLYWPVRGSE